MIVFISADDDSAKKRVETLLESFGYSVIDIGNLRDGGTDPASRWSSRRAGFLDRGES